MQGKMLEYKFRHFAKPFQTWHQRRWYIVKQYAIVALVITGAFLPVRLLFYTYVSHSWLGNLGVMSCIAVVIFVLVHKNKLGTFGKYFQNRIRRLVFHRVIWFVIAGSMMTIIVYGSALYIIDKGEFHYKDERNRFDAIAIYTAVRANYTDMPLLAGLPMIDESGDNLGFIQLLINTDNYPPPEIMVWAISSNETQLGEWVNDTFPTAWDFTNFFGAWFLYYVNLQYMAWGSHFLTVIVLEEIEAIALLIFYRKAYFDKQGFTYRELGYEKNGLKAMIKENKNHIQNQSFIRWCKNFV